MLLKQITTILAIKLQVGRFPLSNHRFRNNDSVIGMCQNRVFKWNFCTSDVITWRNTWNRFRILFLSLQKQNHLIHVDFLLTFTVLFPCSTKKKNVGEQCQWWIKETFFFMLFCKLCDDKWSDTSPLPLDPPLVTVIVNYVSWFGNGEDDPVKETAQLINKRPAFLYTVWLLKYVMYDRLSNH